MAAICCCCCSGSTSAFGSALGELAYRSCSKQGDKDLLACTHHVLVRSPASYPELRTPCFWVAAGTYKCLPAHAIHVHAQALPQLQPQFRTLGSALGSQCVHLASTPVDVFSSWFPFHSSDAAGVPVPVGWADKPSADAFMFLAHTSPVRGPNCIWL
ncbi:hypothetical protein GGI42DRAFT_11237 [Trichoderma sp. SZMC 28013]